MALPAAVALSGLNKSCFSDGLNDVYNHGALLLKSPSMSSIASNEGSTCSQESGISSMSSESRSVRNLGAYFNLLFKTERQFQDESDASYVNDSEASDSQEKPEKPKSPEPPPELKIMYENRDILDLGANLRGSRDFFAPAQLQDGVQYFFENRSQYSRVYGVAMPDHVMETCTHCGYDEPNFK